MKLVIPQHTSDLFDPDSRNRLFKAMDHPGPKAAVFDADGTLWHQDLGDAFFDFLVAKGLLLQELLNKYKDLELEEPEQAYGFAATVMSGMSPLQVGNLAMELCRTWLPHRLRTEVIDLARALHDAGVRVMVISATAELVVQAAIPMVLGNWAEVHGVQVRQDHGVLTDQLVLPMPFDTGKVEVFKALNAGHLVLAAGDSKHDLPILEQADVGLWVGQE